MGLLTPVSGVADSSKAELPNCQAVGHCLLLQVMTGVFLASHATQSLAARERGEFNLMIRDVTLDDDDLYHCQVLPVGGDPLLEATGRLSVLSKYNTLIKLSKYTTLSVLSKYNTLSILSTPHSVYQ